MVIPVTRPWLGQDELLAVKSTFDNGWVAQGAKVTEFEKLISQHEGVGYGVATTSCTTALHLALVAEGVHSGMDVLVPAFTFVATANAVIQAGATPVLVDIDIKTFNISISDIRNIISSKYKRDNDALVNIYTGNRLWGLLPVHQFGLCCDMDSINQIAKEYDLHVIEDAACALGSTYQGKHPGAFGNTACISFHPRKSITTGEGGMILTDDSNMAEKLRELRSHGCSVSADVRDGNGGFLLPEYNEHGFNYRMTDIQGAIGVIQAGKIDVILRKKRALIQRYNERIKRLVPILVTPIEPSGYYHTYQSYVCLFQDEKDVDLNDIEAITNKRNNFLRKLGERGVSTRQGTHAIHTLGYYKGKYGYKKYDYPNAYKADRLTISLPLYFEMTETEQDYVVDSMREVLGNV